MITLYLGFAILLVAGILFFISGRQRRHAGLPGGRVVYTDTRSWARWKGPFSTRTRSHRQTRLPG